MKIGNFDTNDKVYVIAEIGNNHEGDFDLACEMIRLAAVAGVDAVKFQTIEPERLVSKSQSARIEQLKKFQFSHADFRKLAAVATEEGVHFLSTPFSIESVDFLNELVPAFKIASGDNDFFPLVEKAAATGKPLLISMGLGHTSKAVELATFVNSARQKHGVSDGGLAFLHCVVSYPTPPQEAGLGAMELLRRPGITIGYSDHVMGNRAAELAVAAGARILEKHFTASKTHSSFRDHQLSADPDDMRRLVASVREIEAMLGKPVPQTQACEQANEMVVRRSIAAARRITRGEQIAFDDLCWLRPRSGLKPGEEHLVTGRTATRDIEEGEALTLEHIE